MTWSGSDKEANYFCSSIQPSHAQAARSAFLALCSCGVFLFSPILGPHTIPGAPSSNSLPLCAPHSNGRARGGGGGGSPRLGAGAGGIPISPRAGVVSHPTHPVSRGRVERKGGQICVCVRAATLANKKLKLRDSAYDDYCVHTVVPVVLL